MIFLHAQTLLFFGGKDYEKSIDRLAFSACGGNSVKSQTAPPDVNSTQSAPTAQAAPATQATTEAQANDEVSITDNGVTFVLPKGFRTYNDKIPAGSGITTMVASPTERIAFCAIREEKSPFEGSEITSVEAYLLNTNTPTVIKPSAILPQPWNPTAPTTRSSALRRLMNTTATRTGF